MELASRRGPKDFVAGLAKCIDRDGVVSAETKLDWQQRKKHVTQLLLNSKGGGRLELFNDRPMTLDIVQYCAHDVVLLPMHYRVYNSKLQAPGGMFWRKEVRASTQDRIKLSQSLNYDGQAPDKVCGPWDVDCIEKAQMQME